MIKKTLLIGSIFTLVFSSVLAQTPTFEWANSMGGPGYDYSYSIVLDNFGNVYTTGYFNGTVDFDSGPGVFYLTSNGPRDIFISKLDSAGNFKWAKSISGAGSNWGADLVLDTVGTGAIYITGGFEGTMDFDPGVGVTNLTSTSLYDIYVLKLSSLGQFIWAKSIGGTGSENVSSITIDPSGNGDVFVAGTFTGTVDFDPDTTSVFNLTSMGSDNDLFICKLDASGKFTWVKQLGGIGRKDCRHITLDQSGNIYTVGWFENTTDFDPDTISNYNLTSTGNYDAFISKLNNSGNFVWAKNIGGTAFDKGMSMTINPTGSDDIYLTGVFQGTVDFDPDTGIVNLTSVGDFEIFISKLDSAGNFKWAKSMGGVSYDYSYSITLDVLGNIYTTGYFNGTADFDPAQTSTYNLISAGDNDIFISKLDSVGNFKWAKSVGGSGVDVSLSMTIDLNGNLYITGAFYSPSINFDLTTLTNTINFGSTGDIYIAKLGNIITNIESDIKTTGINIFPNPVTKDITIVGLNTLYNLTIYNSLGQLIYKKDNMSGSSNTIDVSNIKAGLIVVKIESEADVYYYKVLKQ